MSGLSAPTRGARNSVMPHPRPQSRAFGVYGPLRKPRPLVEPALALPCWVTPASTASDEPPTATGRDWRDAQTGIGFVRGRCGGRDVPSGSAVSGPSTGTVSPEDPSKRIEEVGFPNVRKTHVRWVCLATFHIPLCARKERPGEFRGAWTDLLGKISDAANSTIAPGGDTFQETGLSYPRGAVPGLSHERVIADKRAGRSLAPGRRGKSRPRLGVWLGPHAAQATRPAYPQTPREFPATPLLTTLEQGKWLAAPGYVRYARDPASEHRHPS